VRAPLALAVLAAASTAEASVAGRVYDAVSGRYVQDARVSLLDDATGAPVADADLPPGQQGQLTPAEGIYRFDPPPGRTYRIAVAADGFSFPSQLVPPATGLAPGGPVVPSPTPLRDGPRTYYLRFASDVTNNHIPLDPLESRVVVDKRADRPEARAGEVVEFTISVENRSQQALSGVKLRDLPDRGLSVIGGPPAAVDGAAWVFGPYDLPAGGALTVRYPVAVAGGLSPGRYTRRVGPVERRSDAAGGRRSLPR
jgi:uncharacterized repeat protein (TIGR01451 family)